MAAGRDPGRRGRVHRGGAGSSNGSPRRGSGAPGRSGGTLAIALLDPGPLDPARADRLEDEIVLGNPFDGLTAIDPAGTVRPAVAASWTRDPTCAAAGSSASAPTPAGPTALRSGPPTSPTPGSAWPTPRRSPPRPRPAPCYRASPATGPPPVMALAHWPRDPDLATLVVRLDRPFADLPALVAAIPLSPCPRPWSAPTRPPT